MKAIIKHERYDETFKRSAVEDRMLSGKSPGLIAKELEMNVQNLHKWKQRFKALPVGPVVGTLEAFRVEVKIALFAACQDRRRIQRRAATHRIAKWCKLPFVKCA